MSSRHAFALGAIIGAFIGVMTVLLLDDERDCNNRCPGGDGTMSWGKCVCFTEAK